MDDETIPTLPHTDDTPPLLTQADLHWFWRALMGELGFSCRRLWLIFLEPDGRPAPLVVPIDDLPEEPDPAEVGSLMTICAEVCRQQGMSRVAILLSRPGGAGIRPSDRRWAAALLAAARETQLPFAPVHLANDDEVRPLAGDDLLATG
jgi:hypothetical protein